VVDRSGNLTGGVFQATTCQTRAYAFDPNGNRTGQTTRTNPTAGACPTSGGSTLTRAYDGFDRPTTGGNGQGAYVYDPLGRQTTIPASDAPNPTGGIITLGYYDSDAAATITQGSTTQSFTLDGAGRRATQTTKTNGTLTATLERHYTDTSDNPTWSLDTRTGQAAVHTRYLETLGGDLGITITNGAQAELALATPRGDTATTITIPTTGDATGINTWTSYTEYGQPKQPTDTTPGGTTGIGYNWLGTKQRATLEIGLTLMGARLYNQTTALFTSIDPVHQGGDTTYAYPNDPINKTDLEGKFWTKVWKKVARWTDTAATWLTQSAVGRRIETACGFAWGVIGTICGATYTLAYLRKGNWVMAGANAAGMVGGGAAKWGVASAYRGSMGLATGVARRTTGYVMRGPKYRPRRVDRRPGYAFELFGTAVGMATSNAVAYGGSRKRHAV
jgi:RHS repeat-associated protein